MEVSSVCREGNLRRPNLGGVTSTLGTTSGRAQSAPTRSPTSSREGPVTAAAAERGMSQSGLRTVYVQSSPEEQTRSYVSPEWRVTANQGGQRRDDDDDDSTHARPERRCSACRSPNLEEELVSDTVAAKEANERKPGGQISESAENSITFISERGENSRKFGNCSCSSATAIRAKDAGNPPGNAESLISTECIDGVFTGENPRKNGENLSCPATSIGAGHEEKSNFLTSVDGIMNRAAKPSGLRGDNTRRTIAKPSGLREDNSETERPAGGQ